MIAVILAAGMAKRLRPLTDNQPKCLLKIGEVSLLQRSIDALIANNIHDMIIVTGYLENKIKKFLSCQYPDETIHLIYNSDYEITNNLYSLWLTSPYTEGKDFLLLDSDLLYDDRIISRMLEQEETTLAVNHHKMGKEEMKVIADHQGNVIEINKICDPEKALGESVGIEKITASYSHALFKELDQMVKQEGLVNLFYERAFERLIPKNYFFHTVNTTDLFSIEIDTIEDFLQAKKLVIKPIINHG
jgi:choline kinase